MSRPDRGTERCGQCGGRGTVAATGFTCPMCGGTGRVLADGPYGETMRDKRRRWESEGRCRDLWRSRSASSPGWDALEAVCSMPAGTELAGAGERARGEGEAVSRGPKYTPAQDAAVWDACHRKRVDRIRDLARELGRSETAIRRRYQRLCRDGGIGTGSGPYRRLDAERLFDLELEVAELGAELKRARRATAMHRHDDVARHLGTARRQARELAETLSRAAGEDGRMLPADGGGR